MTNLYNPDIHHRRSIRMKGYDYSRPGVYFITLCVQGRECLFGEIVDGRMHTNQYGSIVQTEWTKTAEIRRDVILGEFVIMPNHFHGILRIVGDAGGRINNQVGDRVKGDRQVAPTGPKTKSVGAIMAGFKSAVTKRINTMRDTPGVPVWQRNYFEHIIRDNTDYNQIAEYILTNPQRWKEDRLNPNNPPL
jgi:REP element-mobilizing transposase RayT